MDALFKTIEYPAPAALQVGADRAGLGAALYRIPAPGPPGRGRDGEPRLGMATSRAPRPACWTSSSPPTWPATPSRPSASLEWVDTEYNRLELHARFREEGWASLIVDKVLHRE